MHSLQTFPPLRQHRSACFDPSANQKHRAPHFPLSCHFILSISLRETLFSTSRGVATISDKTRSLAGTCEIGRFSAHTRSVRRKFCDKIKHELSRERELAMFSLALKPAQNAVPRETMGSIYIISSSPFAATTRRWQTRLGDLLQLPRCFFCPSIFV